MLKKPLGGHPNPLSYSRANVLWVITLGTFYKDSSRVFHENTPILVFLLDLPSFFKASCLASETFGLYNWSIKTSMLPPILSLGGLFSLTNNRDEKITWKKAL